jgi:hypothetical protein
MARRKTERPAERGERQAGTNAVAAYLTALRAPKVPANSRAALEKRRVQIEQWIAEEPSLIPDVELIQQRLDIDAQLAQIDQSARLPELEAGFVKVAASWAKRSGISAAALREVGVPARVLAKAGLRTRPLACPCCERMFVTMGGGDWAPRLRLRLARNPTPNPTKAPASPGGNSPRGTGPAPGSQRSAAPSP